MKKFTGIIIEIVSSSLSFARRTWSLLCRLEARLHDESRLKCFGDHKQAYSPTELSHLIPSCRQFLVPSDRLFAAMHCVTLPCAKAFWNALITAAWHQWGLSEFLLKQVSPCMTRNLLAYFLRRFTHCGHSKACVWNKGDNISSVEGRISHAAVNKQK